MEAGRSASKEHHGESAEATNVRTSGGQAFKTTEAVLQNIAEKFGEDINDKKHQLEKDEKVSMLDDVMDEATKRALTY